MQSRNNLLKKISGGLLATLCIALLLGLFNGHRAYAADNETVYNGVDYSRVYDYEYYKNASPDVYARSSMSRPTETDIRIFALPLETI